MSDDVLVFQDEPAQGAPAKTSTQGWTILIVDDDPDVHEATIFSLSGLSIHGRPLRFVSAYSAAEARRLLEQDDQVAVILLDVVMEDEQSGLTLVRVIRDELALDEVRIILRTGQPGYAPEMDVIRDYDINDYKCKTEFSRTRLYSTLTTALRTYAQLRALKISQQGLERIINASGKLMSEHGWHEFSLGVIKQVTGLLQLDPQGLVCAYRPQQDHDGLRGAAQVLAATGRFRGLEQQQLQALPHPDLVPVIQRGLERGQHVFDEDHLLLVFTTSQGSELAVYLDKPRPLDETERQLLQVFCSNLEVCFENLSIFQQLEDFAYRDQRVGLPNRIAFERHLASETLPAGYRLSLVDIDDFGRFTDTLGSQVGDALLRQVARRLRSELPEAIFIGRIDGDQFGLLGPAEQLVPERVTACFDRPFEVEGQRIVLTVTQGFVDVSQPGGDALRQAGLALKRAKVERRTGALAFSDDMQTDAQRQVQMLQRLRGALGKKQLFLAFQPQVTLQDGSLLGFEALLRWRDDDGQMVPPDQFIPLAESSGLIVGLGEWVARTAFATLAQLQARYRREFRMAINVSIVQFCHPDFRAQLHDCQVSAGVKPEQIELEITESLLMARDKGVLELLEDLADEGFRIAIDDFGTGYSSLRYLADLPIHQLKIDRSFVAPIVNEHSKTTLPDMIQRLGHELGLSVLAEGVETQVQADYLRRMGCLEAQGYMFARPMPLAELCDWLDARLGSQE
ncbi:MAG: EAL domain-containing protein [Marinobacter sp.]|nr:EAL domain-containing protein [Marinobacter sp.]